MTRLIKTAAEYLPEFRSIPPLAEAVQFCRGCDLYKRATQAVFGEGPVAARLAFVADLEKVRRLLSARRRPAA